MAAFVGLTVLGIVSGCTTALPTENAGDALPTGDAEPGSDGPLIEYRRQGGFAGWDDRLVIAGDSRVTLEQRSGKRNLDVDPQVVDRLVAQLERIEFASLNAEYLAQGSGADLFQYEVTYQGHTVRTMDTAVPEVLQPVLDMLDEIIQSQALP